MRLKDKLRAPIGGFYFDDPVMNKRITGGNLRNLVKRVESFRYSNGLEEDIYLQNQIEDQICTRQPPDRCWYEKKKGDQLARVFHSVARVIDSVVGTKLEQKARRCGGCSKRRNKLNAA